MLIFPLTTHLPTTNIKLSCSNPFPKELNWVWGCPLTPPHKVLRTLGGYFFTPKKFPCLLNRDHFQRTVVFQASCLRGYIHTLVFGGVSCFSLCKMWFSKSTSLALRLSWRCLRALMLDIFFARRFLVNLGVIKSSSCSGMFCWIGSKWKFLNEEY